MLSFQDCLLGVASRARTFRCMESADRVRYVSTGDSALRALSTIVKYCLVRCTFSAGRTEFESFAHRVTKLLSLLGRHAFAAASPSVAVVMSIVMAKSSKQNAAQGKQAQ